jgi:hypothetical protein
MRNEFVTSFWHRAYESLPAQVRAQYLTQIKAAERWELALGDAIELGSRAKNAIMNLFLRLPRRPSGSEASSSSSG